MSYYNELDDEGATQHDLSSAAALTVILLGLSGIERHALVKSALKAIGVRESGGVYDTVASLEQVFKNTPIPPPDLPVLIEELLLKFAPSPLNVVYAEAEVATALVQVVGMLARAGHEVPFAVLPSIALRTKPGLQKVGAIKASLDAVVEAFWQRRQLEETTRNRVNFDQYLEALESVARTAGTDIGASTIEQVLGLYLHCASDGRAVGAWVLAGRFAIQGSGHAMLEAEAILPSIDLTWQKPEVKTLVPAHLQEIYFREIDDYFLGAAARATWESMSSSGVSLDLVRHAILFFRSRHRGALDKAGRARAIAKGLCGLLRGDKDETGLSNVSLLPLVTKPLHVLRRSDMREVIDPETTGIVFAEILRIGDIASSRDAVWAEMSGGQPLYAHGSLEEAQLRSGFNSREGNPS